jgi:hypothetical protein
MVPLMLSISAMVSLRMDFTPVDEEHESALASGYNNGHKSGEVELVTSSSGHKSAAVESDREQLLEVVEIDLESANVGGAGAGSGKEEGDDGDGGSDSSEGID